MTRKRLPGNSCGAAELHFIKWPVGPMDKASASGAGDSRFESWAGHSHASAHSQAMLARSHSCKTDIMAVAKHHCMAKHMDCSHTMVGVAERDANWSKPWQLCKPFVNAAMHLRAVCCLELGFAVVEPQNPAAVCTMHRCTEHLK